jgi:hypothetical protein
MRFRKSQLTSAIAAIAAVLVLVATLLVGRGAIDALLGIVIGVVLAGMYLLRSYARAVLLYRRRPTPHRRRPEGEPVTSRPAAGQADMTAPHRANAVHPGRRDRRVPEWTEHGPARWSRASDHHARAVPR